MKEKSVKHPSLLQRSGQGAPGLFPPPVCQGLLLDETFQATLPASLPAALARGELAIVPLPIRLSPADPSLQHWVGGPSAYHTHGVSPASRSLNPLGKLGSLQHPAP